MLQKSDQNDNLSRKVHQIWGKAASTLKILIALKAFFTQLSLFNLLRETSPKSRSRNLDWFALLNSPL